MKPCQIFTCRKFPLKELKQKRYLSNRTQMTFFGGEQEEILTKISLKSENFLNGLVCLNISSALRIRSEGFVKFRSVNTKNIENVNFREYFHPVQFDAFYNPEDHTLIFQASKDVCKEVGKYIRENPTDFILLELIERAVDFSKISLYVDEFFSTWFRGISSEVRAANLTGHNIQEDPYFKEFLKLGEIRNVTFPFSYNSAVHRIMVTEHSAIVLVEDYGNNVSFELSLIDEAKKAIVEKLWRPFEE